MLCVFVQSSRGVFSIIVIKKKLLHTNIIKCGSSVKLYIISRAFFPLIVVHLYILFVWYELVTFMVAYNYSFFKKKKSVCLFVCLIDVSLNVSLLTPSKHWLGY